MEHRQTDPKSGTHCGTNGLETVHMLPSLTKFEVSPGNDIVLDVTGCASALSTLRARDFSLLAMFDGIHGYGGCSNNDLYYPALP